MTYWVYEQWNGELHSRKMFTLEQEAIEYADKMQRDWRTSGVERHYSVYFGKHLVHGN